MLNTVISAEERSSLKSYTFRSKDGPRDLASHHTQKRNQEIKKAGKCVWNTVTSSKVDFTSQHCEFLLYLKDYLKGERSRHVGREAMEPEISE